MSPLMSAGIACLIDILATAFHLHFSINRAHFLSIVRKLVLNYRGDPFLELGRHNLWGFLPR